MPAVRSRGETPDDLTTLYLADTLGELGLFYSLATVAFIGGSLVPVGGHNPIEPAKLGAPIITGPEIVNFKDVFAAFSTEKACVCVLDAAGLAGEFCRLVADEQARLDLVARAKRIVTQNEGALDRTLMVIAPLLPASGSAAP